MKQSPDISLSQAALQDFLVILKPGGNIVYCNETVQTIAEKVTGLSGLTGVKALIEQFALTGLSDDALEEPLPTFNRRHEFVLPAIEQKVKQGQTGLIHLHLIEHIIEDNGVRLSVLQGRDTTDDRVVRIERNLMETVFASTHEAVIITDASNHIVNVNDAMEAMSGYSRAELMGRNPNFMSSGRHDENFYKAMWHALNTTDRWEGTLWDRRKNGEVYPKYTTISAIRDEDNRLVHYVAIFADQSHIHRAEARVRHLTHHDQLTGLANRSLFLERLDWATPRAERNGNRVAVLVTGLDGFRQINDGMGHHFGDELIQHAAERLKDVTRQVDMLARIGGDEFAILMDDCPGHENIKRFAERIQAAMAKPFAPMGKELHATSSLGISVYPDDAVEGPELIRHALLAQQHLKRYRRGTYSFYNQSMNESLETRLELETALRLAIEDDQLILYFQPKLGLSDGRVRGVEALVRWKHPEKGLIPPDNFIPLAEETGLIVPLGRSVLKKACEQIAHWRKEIGVAVPVAVNLSPSQLRDDHLVADILQILEEYAVPPELLEIELTETLVMDRADQNINILKQLQGLGIGISVDDFGTGYSSLSYLKKLPVDNLKIDRSFIAGIPNDMDDGMIVRAMITIARNLHLKVVAEGVETEEQIDFLVNEGCNDVQGYLIGRPVPADELIALISKAEKIYGATQA